MFDLRKSLLFGLSAIRVEPTEEITDESLVEAMTINAVFKAERLTMYPVDIVKLARSRKWRLNAIWAYNRMYGIFWNCNYYDYPDEVMDKDEAIYQFQKLVYCFSDEGLDDFKKEEISKRWLSPTKFKKRKDDNYTIKKYRRIRALSEQEILDAAEKELINGDKEWNYHARVVALFYAIKNKNKSIELANKKNLTEFYYVSSDCSIQNWFKRLKQVCHSVEDVMILINTVRRNWSGSYFVKITTSNKKLLSKLLDLMPAEELKNYMLENKKEAPVLLNCISYTKFSRNEANKEVVKKFRNNEFESWNSVLERKMRNNEGDLLEFLSERPNVFYRNIRKLLVKGYSKEEILKHIKGKEIDPFIIFHAIEDFSNFKKEQPEKPMTNEFLEISKILLVEALSRQETPLTNKKVYIMDKDVSLENSFLYSSKLNYGKRVLPSLAYKVPDDIDELKVYLYWDRSRMSQSINLYTATVDKDDKIESYYYCDYIEDVSIPFGESTPKKGIEYSKFSISELLKAEKQRGKNVTPLNCEKIYTKCCYYGNKHFSSFKECVIGITTEDIANEKPQNPIFEYDLTRCDDTSRVEAILDLNTRVFRILGIKEGERRKRHEDEFSYYKNIGFTLKDYLDLLAKAQNITFVDTKEKADVVLSFNKHEEFFSLLDKNFLIS